MEPVGRVRGKCAIGGMVEESPIRLGLGGVGEVHVLAGRGRNF